jgi:paraquat-inducible protein B
MSGSEPTGDVPGNPNDLAEPVMGQRRRISAIWIIPVLVAIVAASFAYQAIQERGTKVIILFESAEGLEAGKSKVKYRDVEIGSVDSIEFRTIDQVEVHVTVNPGADRYVREDAEWWVVRPRVSGSGLSGLDTILSGGYVTFEPGTETASRKLEFVGLEEPPVPAKDRPGTKITLVTDSLRGVQRGASVFYRDLDVGDVLHHTLSDDGKTIEISIIVQQRYAKHLTSTSRFWDAGGIDVSVGPEGLDVKTESLASVLGGGIAFDSPGGGRPVKPGERFWLHKSWTDVEKSEMTHGGLALIVETGALGGVAAGNPVYYREVPVGAVVSHEFSADGTTVRIHLNIARAHAAFVRSNSVFWNASGFTADLGLTGLHVHAESLKSLLAGGIAFATPPKPGHDVSDGSVFRLHPEPKKTWLEWETDFTPKADDSEEGAHGLGRFFHHESKTKEEAKKDDATPDPSHHERKHGFLSRLFGKKD